MSDADLRPSRPAANSGTTLAAIVAGIAVLLGFLILRDLDEGSSGTPAAVTTTTAAAVTSTTAAPATTTTLLTQGFEVQVANASGVTGSATKLTDQLKGKGFVLAEPTNAVTGTPVQATTVVYAVTGFEAGAQSVASVLGGVGVLPMPGVVPTESGDLGSATVLVMLGTDQAGKKLPQS